MPYPNESSARLRNPGDFNPDTYRRTDGGTIYGSKKVPSTVGIIWGKLKGSDKPSDNPIPQALRFKTQFWSVSRAKKWLKDNNVKYISFEPASKSVSSEDPAAKIKEFGDLINKELAKQGDEKSIKDAIVSAKEIVSEEEE